MNAPSANLQPGAVAAGTQHKVSNIVLTDQEAAEIYLARHARGRHDAALLAGRFNVSAKGSGARAGEAGELRRRDDASLCGHAPDTNGHEEFWKTLAIVALSASHVQEFAGRTLIVKICRFVFYGAWVVCYTFATLPFWAACPRRRPRCDPAVSGPPFVVQTMLGFWDVVLGFADLRPSERAATSHSQDKRVQGVRGVRRVVVGFARLILPLVAAGWLVPDRWYYYGPF